MKVTIKQTVIDRILKEIGSIKAQNREPEHVLVTNAEYAELRLDRRSDTYLGSEFDYLLHSTSKLMDPVFHVRDFPVKRELDTRRGPWRGDRVRVASNVTFMGYPVFVVPDHCSFE